MNNRISGVHFLLVVVFVFLLLWGSIGQAQDLGAISVEYGAVCEDVINREVVAASTSFPSTIEKLNCFTKIVGAQKPTSITHIWYFEDTERARVELAVNSSSWRTYSAKLIRPKDVGTWHVDVIDASGSVIASYRFDIYQQP